MPAVALDLLRGQVARAIEGEAGLLPRAEAPGHRADAGADGTVSCASCHEPDHAFSELEPVSTGIRGQKGSRKAPPILNAAWPVYPVFFWDGRAASLAEQAKGPMVNPTEMGNTHENVVATVAAVAGYRPYFAEAFGDPGVDIDRIAEAIAAYEATRLSGNAAADRFDAGDASALSPAARRGRELFFGRAACNQYHLGPGYSDGKFHNLGVGWKGHARGSPPELGFADQGRFKVTRNPEDMGAFKTPTLRDCTKRAPFMHDGSSRTLREVMELYFRGGEENPWLSEKIRRVGFGRGEIDDLVAVMGVLDGEGWQDESPRAFPR